MTSKSITIRDYTTEIPGHQEGNTWVFPTCYAINAHGKQMEWTIMVRAVRLPDPTIPTIDIKESDFVSIEPLLENKEIDEAIRGYIIVHSGLTGGKVRKTVPDIVKTGKGKGAAKTNAFCQALRDALGKYNKQLKSSGKNPIAAADLGLSITLYPPMLAQVFKRVTDWPVFVQPKYNGIRCVAALDTKGIIMYSRKLKPYFGFGTIRAELTKLINTYESMYNDKLYIDGELYKHDLPLNVISGITRREAETPEEKEAEEHIDYMIYGCFVPSKPELTVSQRQKILGSLFESFSTGTLVRCQLVPTRQCENEAEIQLYYRDCLVNKFEGAMVYLDAEYDYAYNDRHSKKLLKLKETHDGEFEIVAWKLGDRGKAVNSLMMVCKTKGDKQFNVTPALMIEEREAFARTMATIEKNGKTHFDNVYLGKPLIVYYDEISPDGVPQRARTKMEIRKWD